MKEESELRKAMMAMVMDESSENIFRFSKALKTYVDECRWVHIPGMSDSRGFRTKSIVSRGEYYAAMFSDSSEIRSSVGESVILTDINKLLDSVFHSLNNGIVIDPYGAAIFMPKAFLLRCLLHGTYPSPDNDETPPRDWGTGIPHYTEADIMTQAQIQDFAVYAVMDNDPILKEDLNLVSCCVIPGAVPSLIYEKFGEFLFILIKGYSTMDEPVLSSDERNAMLALGEKYNAVCYWAPVGFLSVDHDRAKVCLALKGDGFLCKYEGLREIDTNL